MIRRWKNQRSPKYMVRAGPRHFPSEECGPQSPDEIGNGCAFRNPEKLPHGQRRWTWRVRACHRHQTRRRIRYQTRYGLR
jgi:hypothetical protein